MKHSKLVERKRSNPLGVRLSDAEHDAVRAKATRLGITVRELVTRALEAYEPGDLVGRVAALEDKVEQMQTGLREIGRELSALQGFVRGSDRP